MDSIANDICKRKYKEFLESNYTKKRISFLGKGNESYNYTDFESVYKILYKWNPDWIPIGHKLINRFEDCKRFLNIKRFDKHDDFYVLIYDYIETSEYMGGRENEFIEFLLECYDRGIVCWDIKPKNFRISEKGLIFIDYGWDIKPFNLKDFLFMVQKIYLTLNYYARKDFLNLSRRALRDWNINILSRFREFFNKVYQQLLNDKLDFKPSKFPPIRYFEKENLRDFLKNKIHQKFSKPVRILEILDNEKSLFLNLGKKFLLKNKEPISKFNLDKFNLVICNLIEYDIFLDEFQFRLRDIIQLINNKSKIILIIQHPFFSTTNNSRPLTHLKQLLNDFGLNIEDIAETPYQILQNNEFKSDYLIIFSSKTQNIDHKVSLIIKTCYQDAKIIQFQIMHIISQLERPRKFIEKLVIIDSKEDKFLRQYDSPDKDLMFKHLKNLEEQGIIDKFYISPTEKEKIAEINYRWFGLKTNKTHSVRNITITPQLYGFELSKGDYILQLDCDVLICRRDYQHDYLQDMIENIEKNHRALSISFNIAHAEIQKYKDYKSDGNSTYVPEVRFCLIHKIRFFNQRPFPNYLENSKLKFSWYRSVEQLQKQKGLVSLRGGDSRTFYIHPLNEQKENLHQLLFIMDRIEQNYIPEIQFENVDLRGNISDWILPKRREKFIFIISGRNITPHKFYRCFQSVFNQENSDWGAIIINDASDNCFGEYISFITKNYKNKITIFNNKERLGILYNIYRAVKQFCINPYSIIIILDADDMLLNNFVLDKLNDLYLTGVELSVGTTLRKEKGIYPFIPNFKSPRNKKGGDVWMHLRTFRKYLYDLIKEDDFKNQDKWIDKFTELTYMIPMVELANKPYFIFWPIYFYEPTQKRNNDHYLKNKQTIEIMLSKKPYSKVTQYHFSDIKPPGELLKCLTHDQNYLFIRHAKKIKTGQSDSDGFFYDDIPLSEEGINSSKIWGDVIPIKIDLIITSNTKRAIQTAQNITSSNNSKAPIVFSNKLRKVSFNDFDKWNFLKSSIGYSNTIKLWTENKLESDVIQTFESFVLELLSELKKKISKHQAENVIIITHNHLITYLAFYFFKIIQIKVDYLNGFVIHEM